VLAVAHPHTMPHNFARILASAVGRGSSAGGLAVRLCGQLAAARHAIALAFIASIALGVLLGTSDWSLPGSEVSAGSVLALTLLDTRANLADDRRLSRVAAHMAAYG
jgi:hydrogenase/urease accessory protein HupE